MRTAMFFIEGRFRLTNQMLSDVRAAGWYECEAKMRRVRKPAGYDLAANETKAIRLAVKSMGKRSAGWKGAIDVAIFVVGHGRHDPDAWQLLGKAIVDGLQDAKVFRRDGVGLGMLLGRVLREGDEHARVYEAAEKYLPEVSRGVAGAFVFLRDAVPLDAELRRWIGGVP
jgi:hypothetical protein